MANPFVEYDNIVPLLIPLDRTSSAAATPFVDLKTAHNFAFLTYFGAVTGGSAGDKITVTVEAATAAASGSEAAIAFTYRLSGATGANTWGAATAATSSGMTIDESADDNKALWIELDPAAVQAAKEDGRWVRLVLTPAASYAASVYSVVGILNPRYKQVTMISAT